jgi:Protein of unknown function (DUF4231)
MSGAYFDDQFLKRINEVRELRREGKIDEYVSEAREVIDVLWSEDKEKLGEQLDELKYKVDNQSIDDNAIKIADTVFNYLYEKTRKESTKETNELISDIKSKIKFYVKKEELYRAFHIITQIFIYLGVVAFLIVNYLDLSRMIANIAGVLVAATIALSSSFKFEERVFHYHRAAESLQQELNLFLTRRKDYDAIGSGAARDLFRDKIDELLHELSERSLEIEKTIQNSEIRGLLRTPKIT